jgi:CHASE2 domain-containing sensor protein
MMDLSSLHLDMGGLIASVFWGGIGAGFLVYARKQRSIPALCGGVGLIGISYFLADSAAWMSLAGVGILVGIYYWSRHND